MMINLKIKPIIAVAIILLLAACKAPMATVIKDEVKEDLPQNFNQEEKNDQTNSGTTPWRQFFTDADLTNLIDIALKNNQDLLITLQNIEIARSSVLLQNGKLSPLVSAHAGAGVEKVGRYTSSGAGDESTEITDGQKVPDNLGNYEGGLTANWEVDIWKKLRTEKQSAIAHYLSTVEGKNFVLSNLIQDVATNYYDLLALDNQLDVIQQYTELQKHALEIAKIQKQAAAVTELGVKKFEAELYKSRASEFTKKQEILEKENQINALLGRFPQTVIRKKENFMSTLPKMVYTGIPQELLINRPDIKEAEYELASAKLDVQAARKEFYPSLEISAALGLNAFKPSYLVKLPESIAYSFAGDLAGPLINKSAIKANFAGADARQIQSLYEYDKTILNAYLDVANLMSKVKNIDQYYELKSKETEALNQSIDISNILFKNSRADYMEVLMTQRDALDSKMDLIEAKQKQLTTVVDMYKSLGGGWK